MRSLILALVAGASLACASVGVEAMPAGTMPGASAPEVTLVGGGCGPYMRLNAAGLCVRRAGYFRAYPYYRPYAGYYRPRCGIRIGPIGLGGPC